MAEANIELGIDLRKAIVEAKSGGVAIGNALNIKPPVVTLPNLSGQIDKNITLPSGNARMAVVSLSQGIQDASVVQQDWSSILRATSNNLDQAVMGLVNLHGETQRTGASMKSALVGAISGPSGILMAITLAVAAFQLLANAYDEQATDIKHFNFETYGAADANDVFVKSLKELEKQMASMSNDELLKKLDEVKKKIKEIDDEVKVRSQPGIVDEWLKIMFPLRQFKSDVFLSDEEKKMRDTLASGQKTVEGELQKRGILPAIDNEIKKLKVQLDQAETTKEIAKISGQIADKEKEREILTDKTAANLERQNKALAAMPKDASASQRFGVMGANSADITRALEGTTSFDQRIAELEKMKQIVDARSGKSGKDGLTLKEAEQTKADIVKQIEQEKKARIDAEHEIRQARIDAIADDEERETASIAEKYRVKKEKLQIEIADEKLKKDTIAAYDDAMNAEIERKKGDHSKKRRDKEEQDERTLAKVREFDADNELAQKLLHIRIEYQKRKQAVEDLRRENKISADEELRLLRGLTNAEKREREKTSKQFHENERREWAETHQGGMVAINSLNAGISSMIGSFINKQRQAKDEWDAAWLTMKNTALQAIQDIIAAYFKEAAINLFLKAVTAVSTAGASLSITPGLGVPTGLFAARGAKIDQPTHMFAGEAGVEYFAPEKDFLQIAREELVPKALALIYRDKINVDGYAERARQTGSLGSVTMSGVETRLDKLASAIAALRLTAKIDRRGLAWEVANGTKENDQVTFNTSK